MCDKKITTVAEARQWLKENRPKAGDVALSAPWWGELFDVLEVLADSADNAE